MNFPSVDIEESEEIAMFSSDEEEDQGEKDPLWGKQVHTSFSNIASGPAVFLDPYNIFQSTSTATKSDQEKQDASYAASLHMEEERERNKRQESERKMMLQSPQGRAVLLVETVIRLMEPLVSSKIMPVGKDNAVYLAEKMILLQDEYKKQGRPTHVSICYHYTGTENMDAIRCDGLLTVDDRVGKKSEIIRHGAYFGDGIYTANNPEAFTRYGDIGLIVAVLKGNEQDLGTNPKSQLIDGGTNTILGNKHGSDPYYNEIILRSSSQVLPLVKFPKDLDPDFLNKIWNIQKLLQEQVVDKYFNDSVRTVVTRVHGGQDSGSPRGFGFSFGSFSATPFPSAQPSVQGGSFGISTSGVLFGSPQQANTSVGISFGQSSAATGNLNYSGTSAEKIQSITALPQYKHTSFEELRFEDYTQGNRGGGNAAFQFNSGNVNYSGTSAEKFQSITAMPQYKHTSFEELRFENYMQGNRGGGNAAFQLNSGVLFGLQQQSGSGFGSSFGLPSAATSNVNYSGTSAEKFQSITALPQYKHTSFEEMRFEDYTQGNIGGGNAAF